jgi:hypothetical protein
MAEGVGQGPVVVDQEDPDRTSFEVRERAASVGDPARRQVIGAG